MERVTKVSHLNNAKQSNKYKLIVNNAQHDKTIWLAVGRPRANGKFSLMKNVFVKSKKLRFYSWITAILPKTPQEVRKTSLGVS